MGEHRVEIERNPFVLVAVFGLIGVVLFAVLKFVAPGGEDRASDLPVESTTPTVSSTDDETATTEPTATETTPWPDTAPSKVVDRELWLRAMRAAQREGGKDAGAGAEVTSDGPLGEITAPVGAPVDGQIRTSVANIPNVHADSNWYSSIRTLIAPEPDFVTLNEVYRHSSAQITSSAPGYTAFKVDEPDRSPGASGQSLNNAILFRNDTWEMVTGGRMRVVDDDRGRLRGRPFLWDRFVTWGILRREDGAVVSLISLHMPTNPAKTPTVPGFSAAARTALYARGMDNVVAIIDQLSTYGPVILGGDMNSHPNQGSWTAVAKMGAAGFEYAKDSGVMYLFWPSGADLVSNQQVRIHSDHPAIITTVDMNGLGPEAPE